MTQLEKDLTQLLGDIDKSIKAVQDAHRTGTWSFSQAVNFMGGWRFRITQELAKTEGVQE